MAVVYWIHLEAYSDTTKDGYVGITTQPPTERFSKHKAEAKRGRTILNKALIKYADKVIQTVLVEGSEEYCLMIENRLRPADRIGWNTVAGGGKPPVFKGHSEESKARIGAASKGNKYRLGTKHSAETLSKISANGRGSQSKKRIRKPHSEETKLKMSLSKRMRDANKLKEKDLSI